jgi:hypothetical protein
MPGTGSLVGCLGSEVGRSALVYARHTHRKCGRRGWLRTVRPRRGVGEGAAVARWAPPRWSPCRVLGSCNGIGGHRASKARFRGATPDHGAHECAGVGRRGPRRGGIRIFPPTLPMIERSWTVSGGRSGAAPRKVAKILNLAHITADSPNAAGSGAPGIRVFGARATNVGAPTAQGRTFPDATSWTYSGHPPTSTTLPMGLTSVDKRGAPDLGTPRNKPANPDKPNPDPSQPPHSHESKSHRR